MAIPFNGNKSQINEQRHHKIYLKIASDWKIDTISLQSPRNNTTTKQHDIQHQPSSVIHPHSIAEFSLSLSRAASSTGIAQLLHQVRQGGDLLL